jgi:hypothetical protein
VALRVCSCAFSSQAVGWRAAGHEREQRSLATVGVVLVCGTTQKMMLCRWGGGGTPHTPHPSDSRRAAAQAHTLARCVSRSYRDLEFCRFLPPLPPPPPPSPPPRRHPIISSPRVCARRSILKQLPLPQIQINPRSLEAAATAAFRVRFEDGNLIRISGLTAWRQERVVR